MYPLVTNEFKTKSILSLSNLREYPKKTRKKAKYAIERVFLFIIHNTG